MQGEAALGTNADRAERRQEAPARTRAASRTCSWCRGEAQGGARPHRTAGILPLLRDTWVPGPANQRDSARGGKRHGIAGEFGWGEAHPNGS